MDKTAPYTRLASAYDKLVEHVDYQEWYEYIKEIALEFGCTDPLILEIGCGTGRFGAKFSADGYTIFGMDRSPDMLRVARIRRRKNFRVFCGDITCFSLARPADFIFCVHDTMNYMTSEESFCRALSCVREALDDHGVFMFDVTTPYNITSNFENVLNTYTVQGGTVEWNNSFNRKTKIVRSVLTFHNSDGSVQEEVHFQKLYSTAAVKNMLKKTGFRLLGIFSDYTFDPPSDDTVMINFVVKKA